MRVWVFWFEPSSWNKSKVKRKIQKGKSRRENGDRDLQCDHCDRKSRSVTMLQRHMEGVHGQIPIAEVTIPNAEEGEDMREGLNVMTAG